jgi:hypothetical protein
VDHNPYWCPNAIRWGKEEATEAVFKDNKTDDDDRYQELLY